MQPWAAHLQRRGDNNCIYRVLRVVWVQSWAAHLCERVQAQRRGGISQVIQLQAAAHVVAGAVPRQRRRARRKHGIQVVRQAVRFCGVLHDIRLQAALAASSHGCRTYDDVLHFSVHSIFGRILRQMRCGDVALRPLPAHSHHQRPPQCLAAAAQV